MKQTLCVLALITLIVPFNMIAQAATTSYTIITNDDNPNGNTATVFSFNNQTGKAKQAKMLTTGGTGLGGGFVAQHSVSVTGSDSCVFVIDGASNDIAAFLAPRASMPRSATIPTRMRCLRTMVVRLQFRKMVRLSIPPTVNQ